VCLDDAARYSPPIACLLEDALPDGCPEAWTAVRPVAWFDECLALWEALTGTVLRCGFAERSGKPLAALTLTAARANTINRVRHIKECAENPEHLQL